MRKGQKLHRATQRSHELAKRRRNREIQKFHSRNQNTERRRKGRASRSSETFIGFVIRLIAKIIKYLRGK